MSVKNYFNIINYDQVQRISSSQINLLHDVVTSPNKKNTRPIQPVYDRSVLDFGKSS